MNMKYPENIIYIKRYDIKWTKVEHKGIYMGRGN